MVSQSLKDDVFSSTTKFQTSIQSDVRYKLIIDSSGDDSLVRLMFNFGILQEKKELLKIFVCSELAGDRHAEVNTYFIQLFYCNIHFSCRLT